MTCGVKMADFDFLSSQFPYLLPNAYLRRRLFRRVMPVDGLHEELVLNTDEYETE